ncbi:aldo/keto reductase [Rubrobacter xylanophilus DSM 9941]|uniref:Aldo/keto reductase n=1 Tax=Rubrobacter xylanophilus (strain DSM 9941 / JCM 11954 / NBRC 16129 / PRD-1) TaxID=266117 RepID=Q1AYR0_RUBXD|nr:aldo/keto reductase [Rubrobacter xylanophilus]ABG03468.1 aldo/keto reductase [Rubrobacter xylanophilus DSM 9941]
MRTNGYERAPLASELGIEPLGVGAWAWGTRRLWGYGSGYGRAEVEAALRESLAAGVRLVDTAEIYGNGESERIIGSILQEGGLPARPVLATKFAPYPYRLSPRSLLRALDGSLRRLGVESVDLYQIHWYSPVPAPGGLLDALAEAVKEGRVRRVGVSNYGAEAMRRAHERLASRGVPLASNQVEYSLLHRAPETDGTLEACRELNVTLIAYSPLAQGLLTGKYAPGSRPAGLVRRFGRDFGERNLRRVQPVVGILREIAEPRGKTPAQVALNWLLAQSTLPIPGAKDAGQARQNAGALGWTLTPEEKERLDLATLGWR